jgi:hypothetical protein
MRGTPAGVDYLGPGQITLVLESDDMRTLTYYDSKSIPMGEERRPWLTYLETVRRCDARRRRNAFVGRLELWQSSRGLLNRKCQATSLDMTCITAAYARSCQSGWALPSFLVNSRLY